MQKKIKKEEKEVQVKRIRKIIHLLKKEVGETTAIVYSRNPF